MLPKYHILIGAIASLLLFFIFSLTPLAAVLIFLSSFLIDIDHYLFYIFRKKDLNPVESVRFCYKARKIWGRLSSGERKKYKNPLVLFHGIEFLILLIVLSLFFPIFLFVLIGVAIHMIFDYIELIYFKFPLYVKISQIYVYIQNKNKKDFEV